MLEARTRLEERERRLQLVSQLLSARDARRRTVAPVRRATDRDGASARRQPSP
jgi:hypothetical protein